MSPQHQPEVMIDHHNADAGPTENELSREERVQALTPTEPLSPATRSSIFHHLRSLFVSPESCPNSVTIEYQNWHNSDIHIQCRVLAIPPPPACELGEEKPVMTEPLQDGRLMVHALIPKDYPGGNDGFSDTSEKFLRGEQTFGITHIYFGEGDIAAYLKMVSQSFKEQSKSSNRSKRKESKGKAIKWKNPASAFGCRYVWAHDLAIPHLLYFRIRPTSVDLPALAVVDTNHDEYRNELGNSKEQFLHIALPHIHLSIVRENYKLLYQQSNQEQSEAQGVVVFDPTQAWWWNIVEENQRRRDLAHLAANEEPVTESREAEDVTEAEGSAGASSESPVDQPMLSEEPGDDESARREVPQTAPHQENVASLADAPLTTEMVEAAEEDKDEKGKERDVTTEDSDLTHVEDDNIQSSQLNKETSSKGKKPETSSSGAKSSDSEQLFGNGETHGSSSTSYSETFEPLLESDEKPATNGADTSGKATANNGSSQPAAKPEAISHANCSSVGDGSATSQKTSKSKKKKSKKKKKSTKKSNQANSETASVVETETATAAPSILDTVTDDDPSWNVVTHGKKRQELTKSKSQESAYENVNQTLSKMRESNKPAQRSGVIAPPPQITDAEFPRLPAVPEHSSVHHKTSFTRARVPSNASHSGAPNIKNERKASSSATVTTPVIPKTPVQPLAPPFQPRGRVPPGPGAFIQLDSTGFPCFMEGCDKRCCSLDYASVICPRCGPLSEVRYCGTEHLFADVKRHWQWCQQYKFMVPARGTLPVVQFPPIMPSFYMWDNPERYRLALHHAVDRTADYFVFSDWFDFMRHGQPKDILDIRCPTQVIHKVIFSDPAMKDRFRRILGVCVMLSPVQLEFLNYLFRMIRDNLREQRVWNERVSESVLYQMALEFGVDLQDWYTGTRHACEVEWVGGNRLRGCRNRRCRLEVQDKRTGVATLLEQKTKNIEANFWILRAHRCTHPDIPGMSQDAIQRRTRGEGFPDVFPEDQRLFVRGPGWDHGATEMEIEDYVE